MFLPRKMDEIHLNLFDVGELRMHFLNAKGNIFQSLTLRDVEILCYAYVLFANTELPLCVAFACSCARLCTGLLYHRGAFPCVQKIRCMNTRRIYGA